MADPHSTPRELLVMAPYPLLVICMLAIACTVDAAPPLPDPYALVEPLPSEALFAAPVCEACPTPLVLTPPPPASQAERGLFQGIEIASDWAPQLDAQSLGRATTSAAVKFGLPLPGEGGAILTPRWALHLLDGPVQTDLPPRLHELELGTDVYTPLSPNWLINTNVTVGLYGDDQSLDTSDAFKVTGHLLGVWSPSANWKWIFGAAVVNRTVSTVVPVWGVTHERGPIRYELVFPRPRIVWRLPPSSGGTDDALYIGGEYLADAWEVERTTLATDTLSLERYGLLAGYEEAGPWGGRIAYEIGYLFARDLAYRQTGEQIRLDDSLLVRIAYTY